MKRGIDVSEVRIRFPKGDAGNIVAWASCVVNGDILLDSIEVLKGSDGKLWLNFPARRSRRGRVQHFFHPVNSAARAAIEGAVLRELSARTARAVPLGAAEGGRT